MSPAGSTTPFSEKPLYLAHTTEGQYGEYGPGLYLGADPLVATKAILGPGTKAPEAVYEVRVNAPEENFLEMEVPYAEQSAAVRRALAESGTMERYREQADGGGASILHYNEAEEGMSILFFVIDNDCLRPEHVELAARVRRNGDTVNKGKLSGPEKNALESVIAADYADLKILDAKAERAGMLRLAAAGLAGTRFKAGGPDLRHGMALRDHTMLCVFDPAAISVVARVEHGGTQRQATVPLTPAEAQQAKETILARLSAGCGVDLSEAQPYQATGEPTTAYLPEETSESAETTLGA